MITCVVEYVIDPAKIDAFERFARRWMELVNLHGGIHHGYFLPAEGAGDRALAPAGATQTIVRGDVLAEVRKIKEQDGRDLALFGHGRLARTLLENGLTDELRLSIHPVLACAALQQFSTGSKTLLTLVSAKTFRPAS